MSMCHERPVWIFVPEPGVTDTLVKAAEGTKLIGGRLGIAGRKKMFHRRGGGYWI